MWYSSLLGSFLGYEEIFFVNMVPDVYDIVDTSLLLVCPKPRINSVLLIWLQEIISFLIN